MTPQPIDTRQMTRPFKIVCLLVGLTIMLFLLTPASDFVADHWWALLAFVLWCAVLVLAAALTQPEDWR